ncbi:MAG: hypothetical protein O3B42_08355 [Actinomycetota bacterium]|nr:hypothetical protein [Actinomycetota bacterium]
MLAPVTVVDPNPKLTVVHLESVVVEMIDGILGVTFDPPQVAVNVGFEATNGDDVSCGPFDGVLRCGVFAADGSFSAQLYDAAEPGGLAYSERLVVFPATIDAAAGTITVEVDGVLFTGDLINFMDGPVFTQIDVNTGGLAEEVTRIMGEATAAGLAAALG